MHTKLITSVAIDDPITVKEARMHLRNPERTDNDAEIIWFVKTAKRMTEHKLGRELMGQEIEGYLDAFPDSSEIEIPFPPLSTVLSIKYYSAPDTLTTLSPDDYVVDTAGEIGRVLLVYGKTWPSTIAMLNAVVIRFIAGYPNADAIPENIKSYMKLVIETLDKNRGLSAEKEIFLAPWAERLLDADRVLFVV